MVPSYRNRKQAASRRRGFTLIELLVVLALIGILALGVVPSILQIISREQSRAFARQTESFVNLARLRAIRGGRPVHVVLESRPNTLGELRSVLRAMIDTDEDGIGDALINQEALPGGVVLGTPVVGMPIINGFAVLEGSAFDPRLAEIVFNSDGSVQAVGALRYHDGGRNYFELAVGPSRAVGRVVVRKWDAGAYWARGDGPHDWKWR